MKVAINSVHFKADKKLEDFIIQKVEKVCAKLPDVIGSEVTLKLENTDSPENKIVDIRLMLKGNDLFASKISKSFEESTDDAIDAVLQHIISMDKFDKEGFAGYDIPKRKTDGHVCLCVFDKDKYELKKK